MLAVDVEREDARGYVGDGIKASGFPIGLDHLLASRPGLGKAPYARSDKRHFRELDLPSNETGR